jgi:PAS domain S-box-containing protein
LLINVDTILLQILNIAQELAKIQKQANQEGLTSIAEGLSSITKQMEQLYEQQGLLLQYTDVQLLTEIAPILIWTGDSLGHGSFLSHSWVKFTEVNHGEQLQDNWLKYIHPEDREKAVHTYSIAFNNRENFQIEYRLQISQGEYRWFLHNAVPKYINQKEFIGYIGWCIDITERQQIEADLQIAKEQLQAVLDAVPGYVSWIDINGIYQGVNSHLAKAVNLKPEDFKGKKLGFMDNPEFAQFIHAFLNSSLTANSQVINIENNHHKRCFLTVAEKYNQNKMIVSVGIDITASKQAEEELAKSEIKLRTLVNAIPDLIVKINKDGTYLDFIPPKKNFESVTDESIIGKNIYELLPKATADQTMEYVQEVLETGEIKNYDYQVTLPSGKISYREARILKFDQEEAMIMVRDISERKLAESALSKLNNQLETIVEQRTAELNQTIEQLQTEIAQRKQVETIKNLLATALSQAGDDIQITNKQGEIEYFNTAAEKITGYKVDEVLGKTQGEMFRSGKHSESLYQEIWNTINQGKTWRGNYYGKRKNGIIYPQDVTVSPVFNDQGEITHFVSVKKDITERKKAEDALKASEEKLRSIFEESPIGICLSAKNGQCLQVNNAFAQMLGYTAKETTEMTWYDFSDPADLFHEKKLIRRCLNKEISNYQIEKRLLRKNGEIFWVNVTATIVIDNKGEISYYLSMIQDITEKRISEEKLKTSLKEKDVLLQEIHHRVKNNLQVISSLLKLQSEYIEDPVVLSMFSDSYNRIKVMAFIHETLYQSQDLAKISAKDYIPNLVNNLLRSYNLGKGIELKLDIDDILLNVDTAIPCGLIINELVSNSLKYAFTSVTIELIIADNGKGLPEGFNFQETESLGLQLVCNLTTQLQGEINQKSDTGTAYQIIFPIMK